MLRSLNELKRYQIQATDGTLGRVRDVYFEDTSWAIRYLVVDTARWLPGRLVLISPAVAGDPDWGLHAIPVSLTTQQVQDSPSIDTDQPVSRQLEDRLAQYYGWPRYWGAVNFPAAVHGGTPSVRSTSPGEVPQLDAGSDGDEHLRSVREVTGYHVEGRDGRIGHVDDLIAETDEWVIRYIVIDPRDWWPAAKVLVDPRWVERFHWNAQQLDVNLPRETIRNGPRYDPSVPINRDYEERLYDFYGRPRYWR